MSATVTAQDRAEIRRALARLLSERDRVRRRPLSAWTTGSENTAAQVIYFAALERLAGEGKNPLVAPRLALRVARVAWCRHAGLSQQQTADWLGVSVRTVKGDERRLRMLNKSGALEAAAARSLPQVPVSDRISLPLPLSETRADNSK